MYKALKDGRTGTRPIVNKQIALHTTLKDYLAPSKQSGPKRPIIAVYGRHKAFVYTSQPILENNRIPVLRPKYLERWRTRTEPLWWSCTTRYMAGGDKRTIRSYLTRLARQAFVGALKKRGYGPDGRRQQDCSFGFDLVGTLQISTQAKDMLTTKYVEVLRQMDMVVDKLIQRMQMHNHNGKGGRDQGVSRKATNRHRGVAEKP